MNLNDFSHRKSNFKKKYLSKTKLIKSSLVLVPSLTGKLYKEYEFSIYIAEIKSKND